MRLLFYTKYNFTEALNAGCSVFFFPHILSFCIFSRTDLSFCDEHKIIFGCKMSTVVFRSERFTQRQKEREKKTHSTSKLFTFNRQVARDSVCSRRFKQIKQTSKVNERKREKKSSMIKINADILSILGSISRETCTVCVQSKKLIFTKRKQNPISKCYVDKTKKNRKTSCQYKV